METNTDSGLPTTGTSLDGGSNPASIALVVGGVAFVAGTYYVVRRGIDRRIVKMIKKHIKTEE